ncbi:MAG TPA: hypothetical protein VIC60_08635 [Thermomicrobiales bacterium]
MFDANAVHPPVTGPESEEQRAREAAKQRMRDLLASLSPPPPIEELARTQGVRIPQNLEALQGGFSEEDFEGFDEFLDALRHGNLDLKRWIRNESPDES